MELVTDIYKIITNKIIEKLEEGIAPWQQPWKSLGPPRNLLTQRPYRGTNFLLLNSLGYQSNEFLTFKQIRNLGATVRKGEKGHLIIWWLWEEEKSKEGQIRKQPRLRYYYVFNTIQCLNLKQEHFPPIAEDVQPLQGCEWIIAGMRDCPKIVHNENEAYYHLLADFINMPKMDMFNSNESYYAALFHELIHSTGHADRLGREELLESGSFGSDMYSKEELTAEIGACFLATHAGIEVNNLTNHVAYIQGWLKKLRKDKRLIFHASAEAQKAVDYILNHHEESPSTQTDNTKRAAIRHMKVYYQYTGGSYEMPKPMIRLMGNYLRECEFEVGDDIDIELSANKITITKSP